MERWKQMTQLDDVFSVENGRIFFRNFEGKGDTMNKAGDRNFALAISDEDAVMLQSKGWNVKQTKPKEEGDIPQAWIKVKVNYGTKPPNIFLHTSRGRTRLTEEMVGVLDAVEIKELDISVVPYNYTTPLGSGISHYVRTMHVWIIEDPIEIKHGFGALDEPGDDNFNE